MAKRAHRPAPRIKAAPKRQRVKRVHVRGYCRSPAAAAWKRAEAKVQEWGF